MSGVLGVWDAFPAWRTVTAAAGGLLLLNYGYGAFQMIDASLSEPRPSYRRLPARGLEWIRSHTPEDAIFLGQGPLIYLHTGRRAWDIMPAEDVKQFHQMLLDNGVRYIFLQDLATLNVPKSEGSARIERPGPWLFHEPGYFPLAFSDREERVAVFSVSQKPVP